DRSQGKTTPLSPVLASARIGARSETSAFAATVRNPRSTPCRAATRMQVPMRLEPSSRKLVRTIQIRTVSIPAPTRSSRAEQDSEHGQHGRPDQQLWHVNEAQACHGGLDEPRDHGERPHGGDRGGGRKPRITTMQRDDADEEGAEQPELDGGPVEDER